MKPEKEKTIQEKLSEDIKRIMTLAHNKENYNKFQNTIKGLKPKKCIVKSGWVSGENIDFALIYEKNGTNKPFDEFIKGIEDKAKAYYFIMGLNPTFFHFNPITVVNDEQYLMLMLKLIRDE